MAEQRIEFDDFLSHYRPEKSGSGLFAGTLFERGNVPIMKLAAAAADHRVCTMTYDHVRRSLVVKAGLNFDGKGYFITSEPVKSDVVVEL